MSFSGGYVYINGQRLEEDYLDQQGGTISPNQTSFTVPEGCLFFLGDNRSGSNDARYWKESYIPVGNVKALSLIHICTTTPSLEPKPSISTSSWFRVCSRSSWPPPRRCV